MPADGDARRRPSRWAVRGEPGAHSAHGGRGAVPVALLVVAVAVAVAVYLVAGPPHDGDLAAQTARADIFGRVGDVPWFAGWYAGLHLGGYSLVTPPLLWWLHPAGLGVACLALTGPLALALFTTGGARRPLFGAVVLTGYQLSDLLSGRVTFAAGSVFALAALLAAERGRGRLAAAAAPLASLTSPVDGLIVALFALVYLAGPGQQTQATAGRRGRSAAVRAGGRGLLAGAAVGLAVMVYAFPDPGFEPFTFAAMRPAALICAAVVLLPVGPRVRRGAGLALLFTVGAYLVHSPIGSNAQRLPLLLAVPAVAAALAGPRFVAVVVGIGLGIWPYQQLHDDLSAAREPAAQAAFYAPLAAELATQPLLDGHRLEVVEPQTHWQVVYLRQWTLARGWERQLDESLNPTFYGRDGGLTPTSYRAFLDRNAVAEVAVPHGTPVDFGSTGEANLLATGLPYLTAVWSDPHWTLYAVTDPSALASGDGVAVTALGLTGVTVTVPAPGTITLALRFSPYLTVSGGSLRQGPGDTTVLHADRGGVLDVHARWSLGAVLTALG